MGLKHYADMKDAPLSGMLRQARIKTENKLMDLSDSSWKDWADTDRRTGAYMIFYQYGTIEHKTHVPVPVGK